LIIVMVLNILGPLAPSLYAYWLARKAKNAAESGETDAFMTQEHMNKVFMGPEFKVGPFLQPLSSVPSLTLPPCLNSMIGYEACIL
jgi:hypothetical protein